jgi:hypothetical protein
MRPEIKWGLITGISVCLWILMEYVFGLHTTRSGLGAYTGLLSHLIPLTTLYLLLRHKRRQLYDGRLSLASGIYSGMYASLVAGLLIYTFLTAYTHFINPLWIDQALEVKVASWRAQQIPEKSIQEKITLYRQAYTPAGLLRSTVLGQTLNGGLFSLVLTLLLRRLPFTPPRLPVQ